MAEEGLNAKIDRLIDSVESGSKRKEKKFGLPFMTRTGASGKLKKNYVLVILLKTNGQVTIDFSPIQDEMVYIKSTDTYHSATTDFIGYYKKYPTIILPEWDLQPIPLNREKLMKEATDEKRLADPQKVIIDAIKKVDLHKRHGAMSGKTWFWILIGAVVIGYLVYQSQGGGGL